jgi:outer membrane lipoprotein SlyB
MNPISYGDVNRILKMKRFSSSLLGAGLGSAGGYALGDYTGWYDPWKGALAGGIAGGAAGALIPRQAYNKAEIEQKAQNVGQYVEQAGGKVTPGLIPYDGYWVSPAIGSTLLGLSSAYSMTDDPYKIALGGIGGLVAGQALDRHMLRTTKFPSYT